MFNSINATNNGVIQPISLNDYIVIPGSTNPIGGGSRWLFYALPEVSESKDASYSDIEILGRSSPVKTYRGSGYRVLNVTFPLNATSERMHAFNLAFVRAIASLTHPQYQQTYLPPPIATFKLGSLISGPDGGGVNVACMNYGFSMSPDTAWSGSDNIVSLVPLNLPLQCEFHVVYPYFNLPGSADVISGKY